MRPGTLVDQEERLCEARSPRSPAGPFPCPPRSLLLTPLCGLSMNSVPTRADETELPPKGSQTRRTFLLLLGLVFDHSRNALKPSGLLVLKRFMISLPGSKTRTHARAHTRTQPTSGSARNAPWPAFALPRPDDSYLRIKKVASLEKPSWSPIVCSSPYDVYTNLRF